MNTFLLLALLRRLLVALTLGIILTASMRATPAHDRSPVTPLSRPVDEWADVRLGDVVFIHVVGPLSTQIASASNGWVSHVGIIVDRKNGDWIVAESAVPFSRHTTLTRFLRRSVHGQYAIKRLKSELTPAQLAQLRAAADHRMGRIYDFGFNLDAAHSSFCSKFVYQVVRESSGQELGEVQSFRTVLAHNSRIPVWFWRTWYFGRIPWDRRTVTPGSQFESPLLVPVRAST